MYAVPVFAMTGLLLYQGARLIGDPSKRRAYRLFHTSNFYLFAVLLAIIVAAAVHVAWPAF